MRGLSIGVCLLAIAGTSLAAPKHKKKSDKTTKAKGKDAGSAKAPADGGEIEMEPEGSAAAPPPTAPPPAAPPAAEASASAAPPTAGALPLAIADRPLTMAKKKIEIHGALPITVLSLPDLMGGSTSTTAEGLAFGASYGIDDKLEVGADYAIALHPGSLEGPFALHGAYQLVHDAKLDVAVAGALVIEPIDTVDPVTMNSSTTVYAALALGAWARYRITPMVSVFSGLPALPNGNTSLPRLSFALPPQPYQLTLGFNNSGPIALDVPVGVGVQATPKIYAFAALTLAHIKLANTQNAFLFADFIPISIGAFYSLPKLDLGASFATDGNRNKGAGLYEFQLVGRYFL